MLRIFFLKTSNFHCTRRSKNWEFQILQVINFLKSTKMIPECQDLLRLLVCASWSCTGVPWTCRDIAITTFWIYIPPSTRYPLKNMDHRKYAKNLIFQSRLSCWFWDLVALLMALKWRLRSPLSLCRIVCMFFRFFLDRFFSAHSEFKQKDGSSKIFWKPHFSNYCISSILNVI